MKLVPLNKGLFAQVDDEDFERVSEYRWSISSRKSSSILYAVHTNQDNRSISMHRFIMGCKNRDGKLVDHKDRNGLNNQKSNLRFCTHSENMSNRSSHKGSTSKYLGVYRQIIKAKRFKKKLNKETVSVYYSWASRITVNKKHISLGNFRKEEDAAKAYDAAARKYHGEFASLNFEKEYIVSPERRGRRSAPTTT